MATTDHLYRNGTLTWKLEMESDKKLELLSALRSHVVPNTLLSVLEVCRLSKVELLSFLIRCMCHHHRQNRASLCLVAQHKSSNTQCEGWQEHSGPTELGDVHMETPSPVPASLTFLSILAQDGLFEGTVILSVQLLPQ